MALEKIFWLIINVICLPFCLSLMIIYHVARLRFLISTSSSEFNLSSPIVSFIFGYVLEGSLGKTTPCLSLRLVWPLLRKRSNASLWCSFFALYRLCECYLEECRRVLRSIFSKWVSYAQAANLLLVWLMFQTLNKIRRGQKRMWLRDSLPRLCLSILESFFTAFSAR